MAGSKKKVLLIGWDAADWKIIHPLMDQGLMPHLAGMTEKGISGNLETLDPPLSPMLWTSIATGVRPYKHGITGFTEVTADGKGLRPVTLKNRRKKAIWNMLSDHGYKTHVVGWWPSHPAEAVNGIMISNFYQRAGRPITEPWEMKKGTVYPEDRAEQFAAMRIHPGELTENHMAAFVPKYGKVDQEKERGLQTLARILADNSSIHAAATYILEYEDWDFMAVYYDGIDHFNHAFMRFHPPRREHIDKRMYEIYKDVVTAGYRYHDMMLGRLLNLAGPDTTVMLISDHGFHQDHMRKHKLLKDLAGPADEHSRYGVICAQGPGIRRDDLLYGAGILDITPTLLNIYGLPVGRDMDGSPLALHETPLPVKSIPTWDEGDARIHGQADTMDEMDRDALQQLVDLGYIEDPGKDEEAAAKKTTMENQYFLARSYLDGRKYEEARSAFAGLFAEKPWERRFVQGLISCLMKQQHFNRAEKAIETYRQAALKRQDELAAEAEKKEKEYTRVDPGPSADLMRASLFMSQQRADDALPLLQPHAQSGLAHGKLHLRIGNCMTMKQDWKQAAVAFREELKYNFDEPEAHHGLGYVRLREGKPSEAVEHFLDATGLRFQYPVAHYHLGEALYKLEDWENALRAYRVALAMQPGMNKSRMRIIRILEEKLERPDEAAPYREMISDPGMETVYVVTGLPRSGTSMVMRMLEQGGLGLYADRERSADTDNPHGYYEHLSVTRLAKDSRWIGEAAGKALKVVSPLLPYLPPRYRYKVILVERPLDQVMQSQQVMLRNRGKSKSISYSMRVMDSYRKVQQQAEDWFSRYAQLVEVLRLPYEEVVANPHAAATRIREFTGLPLDTENMQRAVDPTLHRNKSAPRQSSPA